MIDLSVLSTILIGLFMRFIYGASNGRRMGSERPTNASRIALFNRRTKFLPLFGIVAAVSVLLPWNVGVAAEVVRVPLKPVGSGPLFQIHYGAKWGFMDARGDTVIPPQFDDEGDFFGGLAKVQVNRKWGYVNANGHLSIPFQFNNAGDFSEGLAPVQVDRRWGFINQLGEMVIKPQFEAAASFKDGLARFGIWDTVQCDPLSYGKVNRSEFYTKENAPLYAFQLLTSTNLPVTPCFPQNALFGFVDKHGNVAISPTFLEALDFSEQLAPVRLERSSEPRWGYIDKTGRMVVKPKFDQARMFSEGLAAVETGFRAENGRKVAGMSGFVKHDGTFAIPPDFAEVMDFSEGLAAVLTKDGEWGFVNRRGIFIIPPMYETASSFSGGVSLVSPCGESENCYINQAGGIALEIKLEGYKWPFSGGLTVSGYLGRRKYIDRNGKTVAPYELNPRPY